MSTNFKTPAAVARGLGSAKSGTGHHIRQRVSAIALALLRAWRLRLMVLLQLAMVAAYTLSFSVLAPALWLLPLGGLLKNLPVLALIAIHGILEDER